jgi:hypothetical protein
MDALLPVFKHSHAHASVGMAPMAPEQPEIPAPGFETDSKMVVGGAHPTYVGGE